MDNILGPRNLRGILGETFKIIGRNLLSLLAIMASAQVPIWVAIFGIRSIEIRSQGPPSIIGAIGEGLLLIVAYAFLVGALIHAVSEQYLRPTVDIGRACRVAWRRLGALTAVLILIFLFRSIVNMLSNIHLFVGVVGFCVAMYFMVRWACALQAALLERLGPFKALSRSFALARGNSWRILGLYLVVFMIFFVIFGVSNILCRILLLERAITASPAPLFVVIALLPTAITVIPLTLIVGIGFTLLYYDLRVRKEGYNLDWLAKELHIKMDSDSHEKNL